MYTVIHEGGKKGGGLTHLKNKNLPQVLPRGNHHIILLAFFPKFIVVK